MANQDRCPLPEVPDRNSGSVKSQPTAPGKVTGAPFVFCRCVRLNPSRMPSLEFFTQNCWTVLEVIGILEQVALELWNNDPWHLERMQR